MNMAASDTNDYAKGSFLYSDKDWYHGQLTRAEADKELLAFGRNCYLIRESKGTLVLSLLFDQKTCHIKIKYGPGWYRLDNESASESFPELDQLLSYYQSHIINDQLNNVMLLGEVCAKKEKAVGDSGVYAKASPSVSDKTWYHGELKAVRAEQALVASDNDCFLVRESEGSLILSIQHNRNIQHLNILYGPGWYKLESSSEPRFTDLDRLVSYYRKYCISDLNQTRLGEPCIRISNEGEATLNPESRSPLTSQGLYSKGEPADLSEHVWYHGNVNEEQATQELRAMKKDAFLVRQDENRNLFLSIKVGLRISHTKILYNPHGYSLEKRKNLFPTVHELIVFYQQFLTEGKVPGTACVKIQKALVDQPHRYYTISTDPTKYMWYHGAITEDQAYIILRNQDTNCFLVRCLGGKIILSCVLKGYAHHYDIIDVGYQSYRLESREDTFESIPDLISHYQKFPVIEGSNQLLGHACDFKISDKILKSVGTSENQKQQLFKKKNNLINIKWNECADMPIPRSASQAVKIGTHVYVGGGMTGTDSLNIYRYSLEENEWQLLPPSPTLQNSLASLDDELIILGGQQGYSIINTVYTLRANNWIEVLPPMPTPRFLSSSATYQNRIIITAGGVTSSQDTGRFTRTDLVEVYVKNKQWFSSKRLPFISDSFSLCIINSNCYILGGGTNQLNQCRIATFTSISSLLEEAEPADSTYSVPQCPHTWEVLKTEHPLLLASPAKIRKKLIATGGTHEGGLRCGTQYISTYDFATNTWVECKGAELPVPLYRTTVIDIGNDQIMCIGGQPKNQTFSAKVFIGTYNTI